MVTIQTFCDGVPGRINEDRYFVSDDGRYLTAVVADGVTVGVESVALQPLFNGLTAAAYAAALTCAVIAQHPTRSPAEQIAAANGALAAQMIPIYGALTAEAVFAAEPNLADYRDDPRLFRLVLPACVIVVARFDLAERHLEYAYAGDSELLLIAESGEIHHLTGGLAILPMQPPLDLYSRLVAQHPDALPPVEADKTRIRNLRGRIHHNYVDLDGQPELTRGVGVINGQAELAHYVRGGSMSLDGIIGALVCTDGMVWPERDHTVALTYLVQRIAADGIAGYYATLRDAERRIALELVERRGKAHDDAAAIYVKF